MEVFWEYSGSPQIWAKLAFSQPHEGDACRGGWAFLEQFDWNSYCKIKGACVLQKLLCVQYWMFFQISAGNRRQRQTFSSHKFSISAVMWCYKRKVWRGNMQRKRLNKLYRMFFPKKNKKISSSIKPMKSWTAGVLVIKQHGWERPRDKDQSQMNKG